MAIEASAGLASPGAGLWAQIQQQQAQKNADQARQQARALQAQARQAQTAADRAQENARLLQSKSSQAQVNADHAQRGVQAMKSLKQIQQGIGELRSQIAEAVQTPSSAQPSPPVVNSSGQMTGTQVNVTA